MANRTVKDAHTIKGTNPQHLIEKIIRTRIYDCKYWKEECFALTSELIVDKAMELRYVGGTHAGNIKPSPFLCLTLKMLQIQPEKEIVVEFIRNEDFKYVRALGAFYLRLTADAIDCYKYLEPLLNDYRKIRQQKRDGNFELWHIDELVDALLVEERVFDVILPRLQKRHVLEEAQDLLPRVSVLEDDLNADDDEDDNSEDADDDNKGEKRSKEVRKSSRDDDRRRSRRSASRERRRTKDRRGDERRRSRSRSRDRSHKKRAAEMKHGGKSSRYESKRRRDEDTDDGSRSKRRHRTPERKKGARSGGKDELSVEETNRIRASIGLPPLK